MKLREALCFDDVLLIPKHFSEKSRSNISLKTNVAGINLDIPIISANMPSVCETDMAIAMANVGGLGIIHRMDTIFNQSIMVQKAKEQVGDLPIGAAIGIGDDWVDRTETLINAGADLICIDVAHGDQQKVFDVALQFKSEFGLPLIVGNFATRDGCLRLTEKLDIVGLCKNVALKVGVGGGSTCITRIQTGCGLPTLESLLDIGDVGVDLIADGGIKTSGDVVKSLSAGAHAVMLGGLLAGTDEAPGAVIRTNSGVKCKVYRGSASYAEKKQFFGKAEYIEGEEVLVEYKGPVKEIIERLCEGIRSGFSYCGSLSILELQMKAEFVKITPSGHKESLPHAKI